MCVFFFVYGKCYKSFLCVFQQLKLMKSGPAPTQAARNKPRAAAAAPVSTKPKPTAPPAEPAAAAAPENVANSSNVDVEGR